MLPGPILLKACPHCSANFLLRTLASGNTFGAVLYSDGRLVAPMLPDSPRFQVCQGCARPFWIHEATDVGSSESAAGDCSESVPMATLPTAEEFLAALEWGLASGPKEERYLRLGWWWAANDSERSLSGDRRPPDRPADWEANLDLLANLMDPESPQDRLTLAEISRERGRLEEAAVLLSGPFPEELEPFAEALRALVERRSTRVEVVRPAS